MRFGERVDQGLGGGRVVHGRLNVSYRSHGGWLIGLGDSACFRREAGSYADVLEQESLSKRLGPITRCRWINGRTLGQYDLVTGLEVALHYDADGKSDADGHGLPPRRHRCEIRDGRRIERPACSETGCRSRYSPSTGAA